MTSTIAFARDRRLVELHQAGGGADAFVQLYALHYPRLVRLCRRSLGSDAHLAEDIAQEAFVRALVGLDSLGGERLFFPWLVVIARRLIAMHFRRAWRRAAAYERARAGASFVVAGPEEATVDWVAEAAARARAVEALGRIPLRYREVIRLRVWEELSYAEIAERMGITLTAVAPLLHRARVALRREFDALAPGEPMTALVGLASALWAALRRARDRGMQWAATLPDVGVMGVPVAVGLAGLGALLGAGLLAGTVPAAVSTGLGLTAPVHAGPGGDAGRAAASAWPADAAGPPEMSGPPVRLPARSTWVGQGVFNDDDRLRNGVVGIGTGEEARRDRERSRAMPQGQEIGPIWWSMDPHQARQLLRQVKP